MFTHPDYCYDAFLSERKYFNLFRKNEKLSNFLLALMKFTSLLTSTRKSATQFEKSGRSQTGLPNPFCSHILIEYPSKRFGQSPFIGDPGELDGQYVPNIVSFEHNSIAPMSTTLT